MKILLDTNIVLDIVCRRGPWLADAEPIWQAALDGRIEACITATCLTDVYYVGRKQIGNEAVRTGIRSCLADLTVLPVDKEVLSRALSLSDIDFEDAVQIVCAQNAGVALIVTRDATGFPSSASLGVLPPAELSKRLGTGTK